jgi:hypothetical protein
MVRIEKVLPVPGPTGKAGLAELVDGRRQLILHHMFDPADPPPGRSGAHWKTAAPAALLPPTISPTLPHPHAAGHHSRDDLPRAV